MRDANTLVSVGLPVRNGGARIDAVVKSVLTKDHENLELVICDNSSTDDAEELVSRPRRTEQPHRLSTDDNPSSMS
jgi:glycosyltransferase involved in cell wall biosynthesis